MTWHRTRAIPDYPADIAGHWTGFPAEFSEGVDAGVVWTNGKAYFFKGSQFVRFDLPAERVDPGYPKTISSKWPGVFTEDIDAVVVWPNGKAYFFKGAQYVRYDIARNKVDAGIPGSNRGELARDAGRIRFGHRRSSRVERRHGLLLQGALNTSDTTSRPTGSSRVIRSPSRATGPESGPMAWAADD